MKVIGHSATAELFVFSDLREMALYRDAVVQEVADNCQDVHHDDAIGDDQEVLSFGIDDFTSTVFGTNVNVINRSHPLKSMSFIDVLRQ